VWALRDFGIKAVIASSFGDIFYNNCFKNNVLPIKLDKDEVEMLFEKTKENILEISIDLQKKEINLNEKIIHFEVEDHLINRIIFDLDDVDITLKEKNKILKFEKERIKNKPWIYAND
jgi:3-isopropylmalate dehydratase small subunit